MSWPLVVQRIVKRTRSWSVFARRMNDAQVGELMENNSLKIARRRPFLVASTDV